MRHIALFAVLLTLLPAFGQKTLPTTTVGNADYYYHQVKNNESLYNIARTMGTSTDVLLRYNPGAGDGVERGQTLLVPVSAVSSDATRKVESAFSVNTQPATVDVSAMSATPVSYTLQPGDNLYTVAKSMNSSVEGILNSNPSLSPEDYVAGTTVRVVPNSALPFELESTELVFEQYKVGDNESFYQIAQRYHTDSGLLQSANPNSRKPQRGKYLAVPVTRTSKRLTTMRDVDIAELEAYYSPRINDIAARLQAERRQAGYRVAMVLPFQLHKETPPQQALLYTDFYKGFLLALDSVAAHLDTRIDLHVYDTRHNLNVTDSLLALPEMKSYNVIIAPSEPKQLQRINAFGQANNVQVLNCFTTKNEDYLTNPMVLQANPSTGVVASKVIEWFDENFADYTVLYFDESGEEDLEFFQVFKTHIADIGQPSVTVNAAGDVSFDQLSRELNPGTKYVLVPSSGNRNLLKRILPAIKRVKEERFDCDLVLIGYPEYVLYLKDYQTDLQDVDTYLFSRFFNSNGFRTRDIEARYARWFQGKMLTTKPNMTLFGFDTGLFVANVLSRQTVLDESTPTHRGIQNSFKFARVPGGGYLNQIIDIVHFAPDHTIEGKIR